MRMKTSRKVATNLSVDAQLIGRARPLGINLSQVFEQALEQAIAERERQLWLEENKDAIDDYNERVARQGVFSDGRRRF